MVKAHTRKTKSGKVVNVKSHNRIVTKVPFKSAYFIEITGENYVTSKYGASPTTKKIFKTKKDAQKLISKLKKTKNIKLVTAKGDTIPVKKFTWKIKKTKEQMK